MPGVPTLRLVQQLVEPPLAQVHTALLDIAEAKPLLPTKQERCVQLVRVRHPVRRRRAWPARLSPAPGPGCENIVKNFTVENSLILDCFAGGGQIPLAVKRVGGGRRCVAVEINRRYCEAAERRLRDSRP